jgi:copper oxidase (laccase) domain-containing protein
VNYRFTNRTGGLSTGAFHSLNLALHVEDDANVVAKNRKILEEDLAMPVAYMNQVHGNALCEVDARPEVEPTADALITRRKGWRCKASFARVKRDRPFTNYCSRWTFHLWQLL